MRIERINENSIRCTLTSFDLSVRNLDIKELAYGTDKAKKLFEEMMTKASAEVGFEVENMPIMIEAIPLGDSVQLVITKVDDPAELDTRFSKFTPTAVKGKPGEELFRRFATELLEGADGLLSHLQKIGQQGAAGGANTADGAAAGSAAGAAAPGQTAGQTVPGRSAGAAGNSDETGFRVFGFENMDGVIAAARVAASFRGYSTLYKRPSDGVMMLVIFDAADIHDEFSKVCNVIAEYGRQMPASPDTAAYYDEHYKLICANSAIQKLSRL